MQLKTFESKAQFVCLVDVYLPVLMTVSHNQCTVDLEERESSIKQCKVTRWQLDLPLGALGPH